MSDQRPLNGMTKIKALAELRRIRGQFQVNLDHVNHYPGGKRLADRVKARTNLAHQIAALEFVMAMLEEGI